MRSICALALLLSMTFAIGCESTSAVVAPETVPAKVMAGFKKQFPNATLIKVEKETYKDGMVHYEFVFKDGEGKKHEVEFDEDGAELGNH